MERVAGGRMRRAPLKKRRDQIFPGGFGGKIIPKRQLSRTGGVDFEANREAVAKGPKE